MKPSISLRQIERQNRIDRVRKLPLEPKLYCERWVEKFTGVAVGERGYRSACIRELAKATGLKERSIDNNWGKDFQNRPEWVLTALRNADLVNQAREIFGTKDFPSPGK